MKILLLGASGYLGKTIYRILNSSKEFDILGTCCSSNKNPELKKLDVTDEISVRHIMDGLKPDVIIWSLLNKLNDNKSQKYLIELGLGNVMKCITPQQKIIFMSTNAVFKGGNGYFKETDDPKYRNCNDYMGEYANAKIDGERIVKKHDNYIIVRPGALYGPDGDGNLDSRTLALIYELKKGQEVVRTSNLYNTFVKVKEAALAVKMLIEMDYRGIIHLGPAMKESYYSFFVRTAKSLNLNTGLIKSNTLTPEDVIKKDSSLDLSLDTSRARLILGDIFTN